MSSRHFSDPSRLLLLAGAAGVAMIACVIAASQTTDARTFLWLGLIVSVPLWAALAPQMKQIFLVVVILDLALQWGREIGFDMQLAERGAQTGLGLSLGTLGLLGLYALWALEWSRNKTGRRAVAVVAFAPAAPLAAYIACSSVSVIGAPDLALGAISVALLLESLLLFGYLASTVRKTDDFHLVFAALMWAAAIEGALIIVMYAFGLKFKLWGLDTGLIREGAEGVNARRVGGTMGSPITAASFFELLLPLAFVLAVAQQAPRHLRRVASMALAVGFPALIITGSRAGLVFVVISAVVLGLLLARRKLVAPRTVIAGGLVMVLLGLPLSGIATARFGADEGGSADSRLPMARLGVEMVRDRPLTGVGQNNVAVVTPDYAGPQLTGAYLYAIHNKYLLVAAEAGLLALIAFAWFLVATISRGVKCARRRDPYTALVGAGLTAGVASQMGHMIVDVFQSRPQVQSLWAVAGLLVALEHSSRAACKTRAAPSSSYARGVTSSGVSQFLGRRSPTPADVHVGERRAGTRASMSDEDARGAQRVVLVGAGEIITRSYLPAIRNLGWSASIVEPSEERAQQVIAEHPVVKDAARSLGDASLAADDLVVIASPPHTHHRLALQALQRGARRILIEKPPFSTVEELDEVMAAVEAAGATARTSFVRRATPPVRVARAQFGAWQERFGQLRSIAVIEGKPWTWASVATLTRGTEGLESILYDDMPHPLDVAFHLSGLAVASAQLRPHESSVLTPFRLWAHVDLSLHDGSQVDIRLQGSRTGVLANAVTFAFEAGTATIEMRPLSGIILQPLGAPAEFVAAVEPPMTGPEVFGQLLHEAAGRSRTEEVAARLPEWNGPQQVVTAVLPLAGSQQGAGSAL